MADKRRRDVSDDERDRHLPDPPGRARLVHLGEVKGEFKVAEEDPDIRGWDVRSSDGRNIGKVEDLIVDTGLMKVRYMEVKIDKDAVGGDDDRYVVLPIGEARLDDDEDDVYINVDAAGVASLPTYDPARFDRDHETSLRDRFKGTGTAAGVGGLGAAAAGLGTGNRVPETDEFYAHQSYDEGRFFGKRRSGRENESYIRLNEERLDIDTREVERGEARVRKTVETEHVRQSVPVEREEVTLERRPITGSSDVGDAKIGEDEIRVPLRGEELVVDKRVVPTEEVIIRKKVVRDDEVVEADLAKERLEVDDDKSRRRPEDRV